MFLYIVDIQVFNNVFQERMENEQILSLYRIKGKFNLRSKKEVITSIYFVVSYDGKQIKVPTGLKINPKHWNSKKEKALISKGLLEIENYNNLIVNIELNKIKLLFNDFLSYICNHINELDNFKDLLYRYCSRKKMRKNKESAIIALEKLLDEKSMKQTSKSSYKTELDCFKAFIKLKKKGSIILEWDEINSKMLSEYRVYIQNIKTTHKITGEEVYIEDNTVNNKFKKLLTILNYADEYGYLDLAKNGITKLMKKRNKYDKVEENQIYLMDDEIERIKDLKLNGEYEKVRDLFIFQLMVGQRFEDINGLELTYNDVNNELTQNKGGKKVPLLLTEEVIKIANKYNFKLPKIKNMEANKKLREIGKLAKINRMQSGSEHRKGELYKYVAEAYKFLGTHTARRCFISNSVLQGISPEITKKISGHSTNSAFGRYNRVGIREAIEAFTSNRELKTEKIENVEDNKYIKNIDEARKILIYLGANPYSVQEENDFHKLMVMIGRQESKIIDIIGIERMDKVKDIFNECVSLEERANMLKDLINEIKFFK